MARYNFGWKRQPTDRRDWIYTPKTVNLPAAVDLRPQMPPVLDQGYLGSCTANAFANAFRFDMRKQGAFEFAPSRLFIYWNERYLEGTTDYDAGAYMRDGAKALALYGICAEDRPGAPQNWPYDINQFATRPDQKCFNHASNHQAIEYRAVTQTEAGIKAALADGFPVAFGFDVFESFESNATAMTGIVPMPQSYEAPIGGHANLLCGYTDKYWISQNSWGDGWGDRGFCYFPLAYLTDTGLADDFWVIRSVEPGQGPTPGKAVLLLEDGTRVLLESDSPLLKEFQD